MDKKSLLINKKSKELSTDFITTKDLRLLRDVKSMVFATVDRGEPAARIIDVMLVKEDGLYFLTARGKPFYRQLKANHRIEICGRDKNYVSVRVSGDFQFCKNRSIIDEIFEPNPMINDLYPGEKRDILEGFNLYRGIGEIFDLSVESPKRERFAFGGEVVTPAGYRVTDRCTACGSCLDSCPVDAISEGEIYPIDGSRCLECGRCAEICPMDGIETAIGL